MATPVCVRPACELFPFPCVAPLLPWLSSAHVMWAASSSLFCDKLKCINVQEQPGFFFFPSHVLFVSFFVKGMHFSASHNKAILNDLTQFHQPEHKNMNGCWYVHPEVINGFLLVASLHTLAEFHQKTLLCFQHFLWCFDDLLIRLIKGNVDRSKNNTCIIWCFRHVACFFNTTENTNDV